MRMTVIFAQIVPPETGATWPHGTLPMHVMSDGLIALAYVTIAIALGWIAKSRSERLFRQLSGLAAACVIAGVATLALSMWTIWHPESWLDIAVKAVTAIVSIGAAIVLVRISPLLIALRTPQEFEDLSAQHGRKNGELLEACARLAALGGDETATIDNLRDGIVVFDREDRVVRYNRAAELLLQIGDAGMPDRDFDVTLDVFDGEGVPLRSEGWPMRRARETATVQYQVIGVGPQVSRRWLALTATPVIAAAAEPVSRVILSLSDVTVFHDREADHASTGQQLAALDAIAGATVALGDDRIGAALLVALESLGLDHAYYGAVDRSTNDLIVECSVSAKRDFDIDVHVGERIALANSIVGDVARDGEIVVSEGEGLDGAFIAIPVHADGSIYGVVAFRSERPRLRPFTAANLAFIRLVGHLIAGCVARTLQNDRLESLAVFDPLTSLPNRVLLRDRIVHHITAARRYNERFAVISLDLDRFGEINATYGNVVGDEVIKTIASRLRSSTRESDTVARMDTDEFVVLAPRVESALGAAILASKLDRVIAEPIFVGGQECRIKASIGVATYPVDGTDMRTLLERAGDALAEAKGGRGICFATETDFGTTDLSQLTWPTRELVASETA